MSRKPKYSLPNWLYDPHVKDSYNRNFIRLSHSLLTHKSFLSLSNSAKMVYIYMVNYSKGNREFSFPYKIYKKITSKPTFNKCIKELHNKGFIEVIENGKFTRTENIYKFLSEWSNK